jgi:putative transposase
MSPIAESDGHDGPRLGFELVPGDRAFRIAGLTWIVERRFAWLGKYRRLSKDYEFKVQTSEAMIDLAATRVMLSRMAHA